MAASDSDSFRFPLKKLENDRLLLSVFQPEIHAAPFTSATASHPSLFVYLPCGPFKDSHSFMQDFYKQRIVSDLGSCLFAITDKATAKFAGIIGYLNASDVHLRIEMGYIVILPEFQHTHVSSNAIGLLLHYALDLPEQGGLGLRRVQWLANSDNVASIRVAERMGFVKEGVLRWDRVLPAVTVDATSQRVSNGTRVREGDPRGSCPGRHSTVLALCWDDWECNGTKEKVDVVMARR